MNNQKTGDAAPRDSGNPSGPRLSALLDFLPDPVFFFTLDNTVEYINPAFEKVFGWTLDEVRGENIAFIPDHLMDQARQGLRDLFRSKSIHNFDTQRFTKDGRTLDVRLNASLITDETGAPLGHVMIVRDMTAEKRIQAGKQAMFRISQALHSYRELGRLIELVNREIKELIGVEGTFILLGDEETDQLYFYAAQFRDDPTGRKFKKIRFPADQGVSGRVYKSGEPLMIPDVSTCDFFLRRVDDETDLVTQSILSVPIILKEKTIGVISVVNKVNGPFNNTDIELLITVTSAIALPIENARIHGKLKKSYQDLKALNHAKDKVINHLAHEMKTPLAVLGASMTLLKKRLKAAGTDTPKIRKILDRAGRNLDRVLDIQYETQDLLKSPDYTPHRLLTRMVAACRDALACLAEDHDLPPGVPESLQAAVDGLLGPKAPESRDIALDAYLENRIKALAPQFRRRSCSLSIDIDPTGTVRIPVEILDILTLGLIRNSFEYTPDQGKIAIRLGTRDKLPELAIQDFGIGFTREKLSLVFEKFFTPPESMDYATKTPFAFNAGGKGFDLLRMQIFAEKYDFKLEIASERCGFIPLDTDLCPGDIGKCSFCNVPEDCFDSGGTTVRVRFMKH